MRVFKEVVEPLSADEQKVLNQLSEVPVATDSIAERTGLGIADLMPALLGLEFKGLVAQQPGWKYVRK
jgi:predicted Rossmann fold nucleotide-binding protein DprA/Smf involved in DNA uptake